MSPALRTAAGVGTAAALCLLGAGGFAADATAAKDPGLYLSSPGKEGELALVKLHGAMASMKQKGIVKTMLLMGHAKPTLLAELAGEKAEVRTRGASPAFSFYLPPGGGGMEDAMRMMTGDAPPSQARNGAEFVLVRLHVKEGNREAEVGQEKGSHTKDMVPCSSVSLGGSTFKVEPKDPLAPGEYAFYWGQHGFGGMLWDFGVDEP
ncbi:MAG TPA: hypothetical protein VMX54_00120 [Vicinamibacteria bacterium]|nr:hypothetical protein [Vicinamibacteria bacterium]